MLERKGKSCVTEEKDKLTDISLEKRLSNPTTPDRRTRLVGDPFKWGGGDYGEMCSTR